MVVVAQLVRALDCGSEGRGFESPLSPFCVLLEFLCGMLDSATRRVLNHPNPAHAITDLCKQVAAGRWD